MAANKIMPCKHCGKLVTVDYRAKWAACVACRSENAAQKDRERYLRKLAEKEIKLDVVVERDPYGIDGGVFPKGAQFNMYDYKSMLRMRSWTPGTLLRVKGDLVEVAYEN